MLLYDTLEPLINSSGRLPCIFHDSFCEQHELYNVPLKPYMVGPQVSTDDLRTLNQHLDGLTNFIPIKLLEHNVGSEQGLAQVLLSLFTTYNFDKSLFYSLCKVDVNIFWRLYLVSSYGQIILEYSDTTFTP